MPPPRDDFRMVADCSRLAALVLLLPAAYGFSAGAVGSARCSAPRRTAPIFLDAFADEVCSLEGVACAYDPDEIDARFEKQPLAVAGRVAEVLGAYGLEMSREAAGSRARDIREERGWSPVQAQETTEREAANLRLVRS